MAKNKSFFEGLLGAFIEIDNKEPTASFSRESHVQSTSVKPGGPNLEDVADSSVVLGNMEKAIYQALGESLANKGILQFIKQYDVLRPIIKDDTALLAAVIATLESQNINVAAVASSIKEAVDEDLPDIHKHLQDEYSLKLEGLESYDQDVDNFRKELEVIGNRIAQLNQEKKELETKIPEIEKRIKEVSGNKEEEAQKLADKKNQLEKALTNVSIFFSSINSQLAKK